MKKSVFYHAGCPVCVSAEAELLELLDQDKLEIVHLGQSQDKIPEAREHGVVSVPALLTPNGNVLHINYGASIQALLN